MKILTVKKLNDQVSKAMKLAGIAKGSTVVVAVSGGPDSLALLHSMNTSGKVQGFKLHGAHLNHSLRGQDSDNDAKYVHGIFHDLGIRHTVAKESVTAFKKQWGISSTEDAARSVRYNFLATVAGDTNADFIAVGHTSDDQVETVLMHFLRGTGVNGLAGMRESVERNFYGTLRIILRPLLAISSSETEAYCISLGIRPLLDKTNLSTDPFRNKIRLELLPQLGLYNPSIKASILRLSRLAAMDSNYIESAVSSILPNIGVYIDDDRAFTINKKAFRELPLALKGHVIRRIMLIVKNNLKDLDQGHIDGIVQILTGPAGKTLNLPSDMTVSVGYNTTTIGFHDPSKCPLPELKGEHNIVVPGETRIGSWIIHSTFTNKGILKKSGDCLIGLDSNSGDIPHNILPTHQRPNTRYTAMFDSDSLGGTIHVRTRRDGDRFQPLGMINTKKLQDFMVDSKIPRRWRDKVPLVVSSKGIAWVVGWRPSNWANAKDDGRVNLMLSFSHDN